MSGGIELLLGKQSSFSARSGSSLSSFQHYKDTERELRRLHSRGDNSFTTSTQNFPEFETLSLRIDPPTVTVTEREDGRATVVEIESANRAGTLCEVRVTSWRCFRRLHAGIGTCLRPLSMQWSPDDAGGSAVRGPDVVLLHAVLPVLRRWCSTSPSLV